MRFLQALAHEQVDTTPLWLMRQAGRYMPEYRALRQRYAMLELCRNPELACQVTLMPLKRFDLDAGILFSDITMPFYALGVEFELRSGVGPVIANPIRTPADVLTLRTDATEESLHFVAEAVRLLRRELRVPLIGFAGAPFTLAAYLIEGKPARDFAKTRAFLYGHPAAWTLLMEKLVEVTIDYLKLQIQAGVQAIQIFDSWVGSLGPQLYERAVAPSMEKIFAFLREQEMPNIHFGTGTGLLLRSMRDVGAQAVGVDAATPLRFAREQLGEDVVLQGNLDPAVLLSGSRQAIAHETKAIFDHMRGRVRDGFIFNLGHGVLPQTDESSVEYLIECVREYGAQ